MKSENALIRGIKEGEEKAYRQLYDTYAHRLHKFGLLYLNSEDEAAELVQTVFVKVYDNRISLDDKSNLKSYLFKIAVNTIYDLVRKKNHHYLYEAFMQNHDVINSDDTWNKVALNEIEARYRQLLDAMPEKRREIFILSREKGKSNKEIAELLGVNLRTVENQIFRALKFLKQYLKDQPFVLVLFFFLFFE